MAIPAAALAKAAAAALSDEQTRKKLGWIMAALLSPLILALAFFCSLLSGSVDHNIAAPGAEYANRLHNVKVVAG